MAGIATLREIMAYFEETSSKKFTDEWKQLSIEEKEWFKRAVGEAIDKAE